MFQVGQKVVCVDNRDHDEEQAPRVGPLPISHWLEEGKIYTVRRTARRKKELVWLVGIDRCRIEKDGERFRDAGFFGFRFQPLEERKTDISIFTEMLNKQPALLEL